MNLRRFINGNPIVMVLFVLLVLGVCAWVVWSQSVASAGLKPPTSAYFTTDEGKTWFTDSVAKLAPFEKDGKQAVRVHLFQCGSEPPVAGFLERYTTKGKEVTEKFRAEQKANPGSPPQSLGEMIALGRNATEVKRPGDDTWTVAGQGMSIMQYTCKNGEPAAIMQP